MANGSLECSNDDVKSVFFKLMQEKDLDIREKKSAIIDFISAGIETVSHKNSIIFCIPKSYISAGKYFILHTLLHHQRSKCSNSNKR